MVRGQVRGHSSSPVSTEKALRCFVWALASLPTGANADTGSSSLFRNQLCGRQLRRGPTGSGNREEELVVPDRAECTCNQPTGESEEPLLCDWRRHAAGRTDLREVGGAGPVGADGAGRGGSGTQILRTHLSTP